MLVGVPRETKVREYRVGLVPASVRELVSCGHSVMVESGAGQGIGCDDDDFRAAGAEVVATAAEVFESAELIVKVKEPDPSERRMLRAEQTLFTFLHLAPDPEQASDLIRSGATCIAYETVTSPTGGLPLLSPMSEVAGRLAVQAGAHCLEQASGGRGVLLGGVPGVEPGRVLVLGGGVVGMHASFIALGMGAEVCVIDRDPAQLRRLWQQFGRGLKTRLSTRDAVDEELVAADLVIGGVLVPGATAPKLVTKEMVGKMKAGAVIVDVAIDQGGCVETSRPTTYDAPTYVINNIVHYCVANMPGGVPRTSAKALNNATLPYVLALANHGIKNALKDDPYLRAGLNILAGEVTHPAVAQALALPHLDDEAVLRSLGG